MMQRVIVIGCPGSGKTTLSLALRDMTGLPLIHLDKLFWKPGWVPLDKDLWTKKNEEIVREPRWIIDGNYSGTLDLRISAADTIIFLNRSTLTCLYRITSRVLKNYGKTRTDMADGCTERFDPRFHHYVTSFHFIRRPRILAKIRKVCNKNVFILNSEKEVRTFLNRVRSEMMAG